MLHALIRGEQCNKMHDKYLTMGSKLQEPTYIHRTFLASLAKILVFFEMRVTLILKSELKWVLRLEGPQMTFLEATKPQ